MQHRTARSERELRNVRLLKMKLFTRAFRAFRALLKFYFPWSLFVRVCEYSHCKNAIGRVKENFWDTRGCQQFLSFPRNHLYNNVIFNLESTLRKTSNPTHSELKRTNKKVLNQVHERMLYHINRCETNLKKLPL